MKATRFETGLSILITIAALTVAGVLVHREFLPGPPPGGPVPGDRPLEPVFVEDWEQVAADGIEMGDLQGNVRVVVFNDLECPFCAMFHGGPLREVLDERPGEISVTFVHLPLTGMHRFAFPAAHAAECAYDQGRFSAFVDVVFANQDQLGLRSWTELAADAGVPDQDRFVDCLNSEASSRIGKGQEWAQTLGITATPTVLVDGWRLPGAPRTTDEFLEAIEGGAGTLDPILISPSPHER